MKNVVMGTAGHIDHGKTTLVKRLTGVDTDRLEEEKRRGMTIELGFAPFTLPSGIVISIIDVPGHEKFIKTMVAGVTGIDFVMLVIAADEGIMPQTMEHLDILSLLNIKSGVIALTKTDLVDDEWLQMVIEDVNKAIKDTTLEGCSIIPVSSVTGNGIKELALQIEKLAAEAEKTNVQELFRLPIDRVFTIQGHGTVITGTVIGGKISKNDMVEILPAGKVARVREIQVHNSSLETAMAGDRCALNITGVEKTDIEKGNIVATQGVIKPTKIVDAVLYTVKGKEAVVHNERVHVHIGTKELLARVRVLGKDEIPAGSKGYVQLRFEEPVVALRGDRFIIRAYSPVVTIGGGSIICHSPQNRQRYSDETIEAMITLETGSLKEVIDHIVRNSGDLLGVEEIWREVFANKNEIKKILQEDIESGEIIYLKETNRYLSKYQYEKYVYKINNEFNILNKKYPFRFQIDREEIKSKIFSNLETKEFTELINSFIGNNIFKIENNLISNADKSIINKIFQMSQVRLVDKVLLEDGLNVRNIEELKQSIRVEPYKFEDIEKFLIKCGEIIDLDNEVLLHKDVLKQTINKIRDIFKIKDTVTVGYIRDYLGCSRKVAVAILEYLDGIEFTVREANIRKPGVHYMDFFI